MRKTLLGVLLIAGCDAPGDVDVKDDDVSGDSDASDDSDAADDTDAVTTDCPQADSFLDLSAAPGAGADYDKPTLEVTCDGDVMTVRSNGLIGYTFVQTTPNDLVTGDQRTSIPLDPQIADAPTDIPLLGVVAIAVNGLSIFGPNEAGTPVDSAYGDPVYNAIMDPCLGHTAMSYHYHALSQQCLTQASVSSATPWTLPAPSTSTPSPILGWATDGFAIYGPYECADADCTSVVELESGWDRIGDPKTNAWDAYAWSASDDPTRLDRCNGHTGPGGDYHYHATSGFPYVLGCYTGTPLDNGGGGGPPGGGPPGGNGGPP